MKSLEIKEFVNKVSKRWRDPEFWKRVILRGYFLTFEKYYLRESKSVFDEEWDTLIILDACRYDIFKKRIKNAKEFYSLGSHTVEFVRKNFKGYRDVIYINTNPKVNEARPKVFKMFDLWKTKVWNKRYGVVLPKDVVKFAKAMKEKYPNKKFVIHFMQPHYPFIRDMKIINKVKKYGEKYSKEGKEFDPWHLVKYGLLNEKEVWKAYEKNLDYVLPYALKLAKYLNKKYGDKVVITSDHGNVIQKIKWLNYLVVGHPYGIYLKDLIKVPWLEIS